MASNNVNLGIGMASATGMFFTAPAGTALPTSPFDTLAADWTKVGDITSDGITWATGKDSEPLRNWAKETVRLASSDEGGTVTAPIMDTTEDTLKAIFGSSNVTVTPADSSHGKIVSVTVEPGVSSAPAAFLFLMKDGEDGILVGTENGMITEVGDITFAPTEAIVWEATIEAASWTITKDDGQTL